MHGIIKSGMFTVLVTGAAACQAPNNAASTRVSTIPMSSDPTTNMPGTGAKGPYTPAKDRDSAQVLSGDSSRVIRVDSLR